MANLYLKDFAYRNITFMNFLNASLKNLDIVRNLMKSTEKEKKKYSLQDLFREQNDSILIKYQKELKLYEEKNIVGSDNIKNEMIINFAKVNKVQMSKDLTEKELNSLIDTIIYPSLLNQIKILKNEKNIILQLLFPQLINNFFSSFDLLNNLKNLFLKEKNEESSKISEIILISEKKEEDLKRDYDNKVKILSKEKNALNNKIKDMEEMIKTISEENNNFKEYKEKYNKLKKNYQFLNESNEDLFVENENYLTDINYLKNEIEYLKQKFNSQRKKLESDLNNEKEERKKLELKIYNEKEERKKLESDLNNEKEERKKLELNLNNEKEERKKLELTINNEKEERKKLEEKFIKAIEQNNTEIIVKIWSIIEEQNKKYKNIFES